MIKLIKLIELTRTTGFAERPSILANERHWRRLCAERPGFRSLAVGAYQMLKTFVLCTWHYPLQ